MNQDNRNLVLAIVCSALLVIGYQIFFELPKQQALEEQALKEQKDLILTAPENNTKSQKEVETSIKDDQIINAPRISIDTPSIEGSISLAGARIDDIVLKNYTQNLDPQSSRIRLFETLDKQKPYFAEFGWIGSEAEDLPNSSSIWTSNSSILEPGKPILLSYKSENNLKFERIFEINDNYLITITDRVINNSSSEVTLYPYGLVRRTGLPKVDGLFILHEGPIAVIDEKLREVDYDDLVDDGDEIISSDMKGGWIGITDKYWLAALIPDQKDKSEFAFRYSKKSSGQWQSDWRGSSKMISPGSEIETTSYLYAGAKKLALLDEVEEKIGAYRFDLAIDFGWFYFLTKPFFYALNWLSKYL